MGRRKITRSITESDGHFMKPHMKNPIKIHDLRAYFCNRATLLLLVPSKASILSSWLYEFKTIHMHVKSNVRNYYAHSVFGTPDREQGIASHCIQIPRTTQINPLTSALFQLYLHSPVPIAGISPFLTDWTSRRPISSAPDAENRLLRRSLVPVIRICSNEGGHAQQESFSCGENHNHREKPAFETG